MTNDMAAQLRFTKMHLAKHKTSGAVSFGPIRPKWRCLVICNVKYGNSPTHHISTNTSFLLSRVTLIKMLKHFGSSVFWTLDLESSEYQLLHKCDYFKYLYWQIKREHHQNNTNVLLIRKW